MHLGLPLFRTIIKATAYGVAAGLLFSSQTTLAAGQCQYLFSQNEIQLQTLRSPPEKSNIQFSVNTTHDIEMLIGDLIDQVNQTFGQFGIKDIKILVDANTSRQDSAYEQTSNTVILGIKPELNLPAVSSPILVHELFHDVFNRMIKVTFKGKIDSFENLTNHYVLTFKRKQVDLILSDEYQQSLNQIEKATNDRSLAMRQMKPFEEIKVKMELEKQLTANHKARFDDFQEKQDADNLLLLSKFMGTYNELFADLASALFHKNGQAIARVLSPEPIAYKINLHANSPRDFTQILNFKNWKPESKRSTYTLFDPSRGAIWSFLQKSGPVSPEHVLRAFIQATEAHVQIRLNRGESLDQQNDTTLLNQEFFRLFIQAYRPK